MLYNKFFLLFLSAHFCDFLSNIPWLLYLPYGSPNNVISFHLGRWPVQYLDLLTNYTVPLYSTSANHNHTVNISELWIISSLWSQNQSYPLHKLLSFNSPALSFTLTLLLPPISQPCIITTTLETQLFLVHIVLPICPNLLAHQRCHSQSCCWWLLLYPWTLPSDFATCSLGLSLACVILVVCVFGVGMLIFVEKRHKHLMTRWPTE